MGFGGLCVCVRMFEQDCVFPLLVRWVLPTETRTASHRVNLRRLLGLLPVCFDSAKKCAARTTLLSSNLQARTQAAASLQPGQSSHFLRPPSRVSISRKNMNWHRLLERRPRMAALNFQGTNISAWLIPLAYAAVAIVCGFTVPRIGYAILPGLVSSVSLNSALGISSAIASGMIALSGIVFSLTFWMVQFSATAYSPRLVLWLAQDPIVSHSMGVFTATFLYAIAALAWVDRAGSGRVPLSGTLIVTVLLIVSVIMFIFLIQRV